MHTGMCGGLCHLAEADEGNVLVEGVPGMPMLHRRSTIARIDRPININVRVCVCLGVSVCARACLRSAHAYIALAASVPDV